ncbi:hypothetical protein Anapl_11706 [Anas platyrhynchos]|uniref:Uncharacterized protein n=1 Tax=Anas platyrhynchos TaxID=8839 RepID=R0JTP5_ANAPL|nr:hypothetical protein Anapl_11706 [Anas platyrhynchos]
MASDTWLCTTFFINACYSWYNGIFSVLGTGRISLREQFYAAMSALFQKYWAPKNQQASEDNLHKYAQAKPMYSYLSECISYSIIEP